MTTTYIENARIFDGHELLEERSLVIEGGVIAAIGARPPAAADIVDADGGTVLPGLIDAHVHTNHESLRLALRFGVTTELEMQGTHTAAGRDEISADDTAADVRSAGFGLTPPGGHPAELFPPDFHHGPPPGVVPSGPPPVKADVTTPAEARAAVGRLAAAGSDYIKLMIDDGSVEGHPGLPMLDQATVNAGVAAAHEHGLQAIAHALTVDATRMGLEARIDGFAHLFMDRPHTDELVTAIADSGAFVTACVVLNASMIGISGAELADDPRVAARLDPAWDATLRASFGHYPQGSIDDVLASVKALHDAGVEVLVGTDVSMPLDFLGGLAHGASVHHELQYLVRAGLTPTEALRAATSVPARRFGLTDRGRIAPGLRADLLWVQGDPTAEIGDSLNIRGVWRAGVRQAQ